MDHYFTGIIRRVLNDAYGEAGMGVYDNSLLLQYINEKTRSADRNSKSRSSFANLYALYVLIEDYVHGGFEKNGEYRSYAGARYSDLLNRLHQLPFGAKMQNHALNNRLNSEFQKFFPTSELLPILRNQQKKRYWINENLLVVKVNGRKLNIAETVIAILDEIVVQSKVEFNYDDLALDDNNNI